MPTLHLKTAATRYSALFIAGMLISGVAQADGVVIVIQPPVITPPPLNPGTTANGENSSATGIGSTAYGKDSSAHGIQTTAIGNGATSTGTRSVALGSDSNDGGLSSVVSVGNSSMTRGIINVSAGRVNATSTDAVNGSQLNTTNEKVNTLRLDSEFTQAALIDSGICQRLTGTVNIGCGTTNGANTLAIGNGAVASQAGSVAIGAGARASGDPTTAVGNNAVASGNNAVALGANSTASGTNAVALGQGSLATRDNTVSVGNASTGQTRQITNVAAGTAASDAVNVAQLNQQSAQTNQRINQLNAQLNDNLDRSYKYAAQGVAQSLAIPSIPTLKVGGKWIGAGTGVYDGQSALGVAAGYQATENLNFGAGAAASSSGNSHIAIKAQVGYGW